VDCFTEKPRELVEVWYRVKHAHSIPNKLNCARVSCKTCIHNAYRLDFDISGENYILGASKCSIVEKPVVALRSPFHRKQLDIDIYKSN
jgi:hypothetical protein